jgi:hypothetical protein
MALDTRRLALERLVKRRARQCAARIAREKGTAEKDPQPRTSRIAVPDALRKYNAIAVGRMLAAGKRQGYVTIAEAMKVLPKSGASEEDMVAVVNAIFDLGFDLK